MDAINVVIATVQRNSLSCMLNSLVPQLTPKDFVTIINDSGRPLNDYDVCKWVGYPTIIHLSTKELGYWGHGARNAVQDHLPGDWIMHADDDDIYLPGAIDSVRKEIKKGPALYLFRFLNKRSGATYWIDKDRYINNVGTPCGVFPNQPPFPMWELYYGGDGVFYESLSKEWDTVWLDKVIYEAN